MRRIAVINQKGGVGKTTTAVNLGAALARLGRRVLICDLDPQCNLTVHVNVDPGAEQPSLYEVLRGDNTLADAVRPTREPNLWVLPSSVDVAGAEVELVTVVGREVILRDAFEADERAHGQRWDHVLVDCPPSLGLLSLNALVLCDEVLVPVQSEFFALQGLSKLTEIVDLVQRRLNPRLRVTGLLSCRHDSSTNLGRQVIEDIRVHFGDVLLRTSIRRNVKLAEAPSHGCTIFEYDAESRGAQDYLDLAREVLSMELPAGAALPEPVAAPRPVTPAEVAKAAPVRLASGRFGKPGAAPPAKPAPKPAAKPAPVTKPAPIAAQAPVAPSGATPKPVSKAEPKPEPTAAPIAAPESVPKPASKPAPQPAAAAAVPASAPAAPLAPVKRARPVPPAASPTVTEPAPAAAAPPSPAPKPAPAAKAKPAPPAEARRPTPEPASAPAVAPPNGHGSHEPGPRSVPKRPPVRTAAPPVTPAPAPPPAAPPAVSASPPPAPAPKPARRPRAKPASPPPPETSSQNP